MKEELRYATEINGVQCVVIAGVPLMHKLCVDSLDLQQQVHVTHFKAITTHTALFNLLF